MYGVKTHPPRKAERSRKNRFQDTLADGGCIEMMIRNVAIAVGWFSGFQRWERPSFFPETSGPGRGPLVSRSFVAVCVLQ